MKTPFYKRTEPLGVNRSTRDTIITCPTPEELAAWAGNMARTDLGQVWDGAFKPLLEGLKPDEKQKVFEQMDAYRSGTKTSDSEDTFLGRTGSDSRSLNRGINEANRKFWDSKKA